MKKLIMLMALSGLLGGCAWFQGSDKPSDTGGVGGHDVGGRGTTGVSSGAEGGTGITGSDLAPP